MPQKLSNVVFAKDILKKIFLDSKGRPKAIREPIACEFFIHALSVRDFMETSTGNSYDIEPNGPRGWLVSANGQKKQ